MLTESMNQISAWKLRGNLPHAVESTWLLNEACLTDEINNSTTSSFAVKASYITAISRYAFTNYQTTNTTAHQLMTPSFVTGLLDSQQDSKYKVSMYAKAQQIGLPALFVDLRHEATHGNMPSLTNLRQAAQRALQWLWNDYWKGLGDLRDPEKKWASEDHEVVTDGNLGSGQSVHTDKSDNRTMRVIAEGPATESNFHSQSRSWEKWQGQWLSNPIGSIDNNINFNIK